MTGRVKKGDKFTGQKYSFIIENTDAKRGGNGGVYDVKIIDSKYDFPVVVKFFEYDNKKGELVNKRYKRFVNEIEIVKAYQTKLSGLIEILDNNCPNNINDTKCKAWYLMRKAVPFKLNNRKDIKLKIKDMISLAKIIMSLHNENLAHRDIKPENILFLDGEIKLGDFGLVWCDIQDRITDYNERVGPYRILPPELEHIDIKAKLDFRCSDVYLFAKVLWMYIKCDNIGFRGQYARKERQIYIDKDEFGVTTLEPLHKLMECATLDDMNKRITIEECVNYLELQLNILDNKIEEAKVNKLCNNEKCYEFINSTSPDKLIYTDSMKIYSYIDRICDISKVFIQYINDLSLPEQQLKINKFTHSSNGIGTFYIFINGQKVKEYFFKVRYMEFLNNKMNDDTDVHVYLDEFEEVEKPYSIYGGAILEEMRRVKITNNYILIFKA